jgi:hypothetical protein
MPVPSASTSITEVISVQNTFLLLLKPKVLLTMVYVLASCLLLLQRVIHKLWFVKINRSIKSVQQNPIMDGQLFEGV